MRLLTMVLVIFGVTPSFIAADETLAEDFWYGTMDVGPRLFRFRVETSTAADGSLAHQLVSLDEGGQAFPLDRFVLDARKLEFELKLTKAVYFGELSKSGDAVTGKWRQSGLDFDLVFRRMKESDIEKPVEVWSGTMSALFQKLHVRFRVYRRDAGSEVVCFDSVSQKAGGFKANRTIDADHWTIKVDGLGGVFDGTSNGDKTEVKGKWTQGGVSLDLTLTPEKIDVSEVVEPPKRPQTPIAPFPYLVEEVSFRNDVDDVTLAGTLTLPKADKPCPAVVMITGSGPQDRDESLLDNKPFWVIADHLSRKGIAVLRFDDRGTGASTGDFSAATSENFAKDVEAAFDLLLADPRIAPKSIGLIGHSEGGMIAPMVAVSRRDVAFIILMAGTGVNGREILLSQGRLILQSQGVTEESLLKMQRATQLAMIDTVLEAPVNATQEELAEAAMKRLADVIPAESLEEESLKESVAGGIQRMQSPWFRYFLTFEPSAVLQQVKCPVLALNGEKDVQVDPGLNLPAIMSALEKGGNTRFRTVEFPGLNHLFQTCGSGGLSEYQTIEETIAPVVLQTMTDWILDATKSK